MGNIKYLHTHLSSFYLHKYSLIKITYLGDENLWRSTAYGEN